MELHTRTGGWAVWLGGFGQAFQMRKSEQINALAGELAWSFSEEEIRWMLGRGLLLDGPAAAILVERGFSAWLGMDRVRFITQTDVVYTLEQTTDPEFSLRAGTYISLNDRSCSKRLLQGVLAPKAHAISILRDPKFNQVGHGVVLFENELGGRVAICPWDVNTPEFYGGQRNDQRAAQMRALVKYLGRGWKLGAVSGAPWLVPQFLADESHWRGVIWNSFPDAVDQFEVELPEGMQNPIKAVHIDAKGRRLPVVWQNGSVLLQQPMQPWECVILI